MSTRQEKIEAQRAAGLGKPRYAWSRHLIGPVELEFLFKQHDRYEAIRKLSPRQFAEIYKRNLGGERFDEAVDALATQNRDCNAAQKVEE